MAEKLAFLTSRRFWAMVLLAVVQYFEATGGLSPEMAESFKIILGGFVTVATVDKFRRV